MHRLTRCVCSLAFGASSVHVILARHPPPHRRHFRGCGAVAPLFHGVAKAAASLFPLLVEFNSEFFALSAEFNSEFSLLVFLLFGTDRVFAQNLRAVALSRGLSVICNGVSQVNKHSDPARLSRELPGSAVLFSGLSAPVNEEFLLSITRCTVCLVLSAV